MKNIKWIVLIAVIVLVTFLAIWLIAIKDNGSGNGTEATETTEKEEGDPYERWLSAAAIISLTMQEEGFEVQGTYYHSTNSVKNKAQSEGVYLFYTIEGEMYCRYVKPLEAERTEPGTMDLSTKALGFATYDLVDATMVDVTGWTKETVEDLTELIKQSMLVSIYEH